MIIKTRPGSYEHDGWADEAHGLYRYSFKARKGMVDHGELANRVLIDQQLGLYPVLLFTEAGMEWRFEGRFDVSEIAGDHVVLRRQSGAYERTPEAVDALAARWDEEFDCAEPETVAGRVAHWLERAFPDVPAARALLENRPGEFRAAILSSVRL